ncbi:methyltransferase domain-containing protein [Tautonia sociabilis]|uniref:Methyltransferase domain-containing protein n=1 Tax=Tautonia sociabilis TaxID=2080755 RepID=A0A432MNP5_9BACT|nr:methyltransferase domain-containing protein [Tautonia sociabilis]RUL89061.1 methyltransferase domain-containing protein [Tautonia sociabilis]
MFDANVPEVLRRIAPEARVLDVGGWARCFNRADYVIDKFPYETRGSRYGDRLGLGPQGGTLERFSEATWICRDLCDREPWPFPDGYFDFCTCSHTLEDLRDPIWVCSEMRRVARAGYIETPSMAFELTRGREAGVPVGLSHHFWVVEVEGSTITFHPKLHSLHGDPGLSLPPEVGASLPPEALVSWLFWEGDFEAREGWLHPELVGRFVASFGPFPEAEPTGVAGPDARVFALSRANEEARALIWELRARLEHAEQQWHASQQSLRVVESQVERALAALHATSAELDEARARLRELDGVGPKAIGIARRLQRLSDRHPGLKAVLRRVVRAA